MTNATEPTTDIRTELNADLRKTAIQTIAYVAYGTVMVREVAAKHGISEDEASRHLHKVATDLMDRIRELT